MHGQACVLAPAGRSLCALAILNALPQVGARTANAKDRERLANENYQRGRALFESNHHREALSFFEKASEWAPQFPEPHVAMAQVLSRLGRQEEAKARMQEADWRLQESVKNTATPEPPSYVGAIVPAAESAAKTVKSANAPANLKATVGRGLVTAAVLMQESADALVRYILTILLHTFL